MWQIVHQQVSNLKKQIWVTCDVVVEICVAGVLEVRQDKCEEIAIFHNDSVISILGVILAVSPIHKTSYRAVDHDELVLRSSVVFPSILNSLFVVHVNNRL